MALSNRTTMIVKLVAAVALIALGFDVARIPWWPLSFVAMTLVITGFVVLVRTIALSIPKDSPRYEARQRLVRVIFVNVGFIVAFVVALTLLRGGSSGNKIQHLLQEDEIGWSPDGPPGTVGERNATIDPAKPHLLFLGDSILFGWRVKEEESAVGLLNVENRIPGYQAVNASVSGYSIDQYWMYLKKVVDDVKPKLIVIGLYTGNDFDVTGKEWEWGVAKPLFRVKDGKLVRADRAGGCYRMLSESLLFRPIWTVFSHPGDRSNIRASRLIESICKPDELSESELEAVVAQLFKEIGHIAEQQHAKLLFLIESDEDDYQGLVTAKEHKYLSRFRLMRQMLKDQGFDYLDLHTDQEFARRSATGPLFQEDHAHFTVAGNKVLADVLTREIKRRYGLGVEASK
jgi:lysophospholipase L1-like esterase